MRDALILLVHRIATVTRLFAPSGVRAIVAESVLLKQQLLVLNRSRARAPNLRPLGRTIVAVCAGVLRPAHLLRTAIVGLRAAPKTGQATSFQARIINSPMAA